MAERVQYLTSPGDELLLTEDIDELAQRVSTFQEDSGLPGGDFVVHPVVAIPLPVTAQHDGERKRLAYHPSLAWHPLFWLPMEVGLRLQVQEDDGGPARPESTAEWAIRLLVQLEEAGLYDAASGTWLDTLATVGLDRHSPLVHQRVIEWQEGASDADLDRIDLSARFATPSTSVAAQVIPQAHELLHAQWLLTGRMILARLPDVEQLTDIDAFQRAVRHWVLLASLGLLGAPGSSRLAESVARLEVWSDPEQELALLREVLTEVTEAVSHDAHVL